MGIFFQDLRYAARQSRRSPGFFAIATLLIALGIAANVQIFTLVNALLLRPLPVAHPENLVQLFNIYPKRPADPYFDYPFWRQLASHSQTLNNVAGQTELTVTLESGSLVDRVHPEPVTDNYFTDLDVKPLFGRVLTQGDDHVAVLSHHSWMRLFEYDSHVVGKTIRLKGHTYQIVGVAPESFVGTIVDGGPDLWIPFRNVPEFPALATG